VPVALAAAAGLTPARTPTVAPTNPLIPVTATPAGLNDNYHWIGADIPVGTGR
jgi:hypothetical protein